MFADVLRADASSKCFVPLTETLAFDDGVLGDGDEDTVLLDGDDKRREDEDEGDGMLLDSVFLFFSPRRREVRKDN